jgi:chemotaxis protein MotB
VRRANADLRLNASQHSTELQNSSAARDALTTRVAELSARVQDETARADRLSAQLADANKVVSADREKIELQLKDLESLRRDIEALRKVRADLEAQVAGLATQQKQTAQSLTAEQARAKELEQKFAALTEEQRKALQDLGAARDRSKELEARLASEQERTVLAQKEIQQRDIRLSELQQKGQETGQALEQERKLSREARDTVDALNAQIASLRDQLARVAAALDISEKWSKEQQTQIVDLGRRLNVALARKVEELARYRSEFFGRLREILGDRPDIRVVGDRFVFQSEVLFSPASAELGDNAKRQLAPLAAAVADLIPRIPSDLNWVLRVDGHTDRRPISTAFPSNWELSTARAISVVKYLVQSGIPAERLAATGFGEFQPLDQGSDESALRRNRRIEIKLTER